SAPAARPRTTTPPTSDAVVVESLHVSHTPPPATAAQPAAAPKRPRLPGGEVASNGLPAPSRCRRELGATCYTARHIAHAYGMDAAHEAGLAGAGATVAVIMGGIAPTAEADLEVFSAQLGLERPRLQTVQAPGGVRSLDTADPLQDKAAMEQSVGLQAVHAMAPRADLLLVQTPFAAGGLEAMGRICEAMAWAVGQRRIDVIALSTGVAEGAFAHLDGDHARIHRLRHGV